MRRAVVRTLAAVALFAAAALAASASEDLGVALAGRSVTAPDGGAVAVLDAVDGVLDPVRLATCLETLDEAGAWPEAWLVVQDEGTDWDLVLGLTKRADGSIEPGESVALPRADWDPDTLAKALRAALGRKPGTKVRNVVVQGFRKRVVTVYPYETADVDRTRGLMALLPEDAVLREARSVDLGDGARRTAALVLRGARFEPADCGTARGRARGHLDRGTVLAVLAGPEGIEAEIDLTGALALEGEGALPRYRCAEGESPATLDVARVRDWIASRDPLPLLEWVDADGDGRALEVRLPASTPDGFPDEVVLAVGPDAPSLRLLGD